MLSDLPSAAKEFEVIRADAVQPESPSRVQAPAATARPLSAAQPARVSADLNNLRGQWAPNRVGAGAQRGTVTVLRVGPTGVGRVVKRSMDLVGALLLLVLLAPVLAIAALMVRVSSPGPALFVQERMGRHGRPFRMLKFRSMRVDAHQERIEVGHLNEATGPVFKIRDDPRLTPVGRVLRRLSLDELPQLINVVRGDMSLVGPRPPLPEEYATYDSRERRRLAVTPGITCLWQVSGRSDLDFATWVELDLKYIASWSLLLDLKILLRTIPAVLSGRGAY